MDYTKRIEHEERDQDQHPVPLDRRQRLRGTVRQEPHGDPAAAQLAHDLIALWSPDGTADDSAALLAQALVVVVPRHPQRFDAVTDIASAFGLRTARRSEASMLWITRTSSSIALSVMSRGWM